VPYRTFEKSRRQQVSFYTRYSAEGKGSNDKAGGDNMGTSGRWTALLGRVFPGEVVPRS
jgi:hypothetical protein